VTRRALGYIDGVHIAAIQFWEGKIVKIPPRELPDLAFLIPHSSFTYDWCLKYCTARSCFFAAASVLNVPRFLRLFVFGFFFLEYSLYPPEANFRIIKPVITITVYVDHSLCIQMIAEKLPSSPLSIININ
jgi:hypothetical protein